MDATAVVKTPASIAESRWLGKMTMVLTLAGVMFFAQLSERALWSEEVRWAQIPREMQRSGNYLWPTLNGRTYYDKPLGSYWLVLLASLVTGGVNEMSARLPSALSGLLAVVFAMLIARRLYDEKTAVWTGTILATSFSFVFFARNASTDVETIAGVLVALWIFLRNEAGSAGWWTLLLWFVMALTSLTKGLLGFALPILIIGIYASITAGATRSLTLLGAPARTLVERNRWFFNRWTLAAMPLGLVVYLAPFLLSMAAGGSTDGLEMVYRENIRRFIDPVNHRGPIYLYAYVIFMLMAPWSLLLPAALVQAHLVVHDSNRAVAANDPSARQPNRGGTFALAYFWGTFLFFTLSSSRRSYYLLPILPAGAFLVARLLAGRETLNRPASALLRAGFFATAFTALLSVLALLLPSSLLPEFWRQLPSVPSPWMFIAAWIASVASIGFAALKLDRLRIALSMGVIAFSFLAYLYVFALPATEIYRTQKPFASAVKSRLGSAIGQLALYRIRDIVYYLDAPIPIAEYHTPHELHNALGQRSLYFIIMRRRDWEKLSLNGTVLLGETVQPWDGAEQQADKLLLVEIRPVEAGVTDTGNFMQTR